MEIWFSGLFYFSVFLLSAMFFFIGENSRTSLTLKKICILFGLFLPCLVAGLRGDSVGIDVKVYAIPHMLIASNCDSLLEVMLTCNLHTEPIYASIIFFISRFTSNSGLLLFLFQLFTILPTYLAASKLRNKVPVFLVMLVYFFVYYNNSLNLMRQSVSVAFLLLAAVYFFENNYRLNLYSGICIFIAIMFHKAGIIGLLMLSIFYWGLTCKLNRYFYAISILFFVFLPTFMEFIYDFLLEMNVLHSNFIYYGEIFLKKTIYVDWIIDINKLHTIVNVGLVLMFNLLLIVLKNNSLESDGFIFKYSKNAVHFGAILYLIMLFSFKTEYGGRLTLFFDYFLVLALPFLIREPDRFYKLNIVLLSILFYWVIWVMRFGWSGSNIYTF